MKSVDRRLLLRLRDQARGRARQSPRLWKVYKRRRRARPGGRLTVPVWLTRLMWPLVFLLVLPGLLQRVGAPALLMMLALYCSGTTFLRAADLRNRLYWSTDLYVALHYPVPDREFFRWQLREWLIACLPVFVLSAASYVWIAVDGDAGAARWTSALLGGLAQTALVITLSLAQARWLTRMRTLPALALYALMVGIFFLPQEVAALGGQVWAVLPAAWVNRWVASSPAGPRDVILLLLGIGVLAAVAAWIARSLEQGYPQTDVTLVLQHVLHDEAAEDGLASPAVNENAHAAFGHDYAVAQERFAALRNRTVVAEQLTAADVDWTAGHWTTRLAGRWLTPRERLVAAFLAANAIDTWQGRGKRAVQLTAVGVLLCAIPWTVPLWLALGIFIMAAFTAAPLLGGTWPGLTPGWFGFARLQPLAGYPVGYVEASLAVMKLNAVRLLGVIPIALTAGVVTGWRYFGQPSTGLLLAAHLVLTALAVQPYCALFLHSGGTNDTKRLNWTAVAFAGTLIASAVVFAAVAVAWFMFNRSFLSWIVGPPAMALVSWSMWRFYGVLYSRHHIDLIPAATA